MYDYVTAIKQRKINVEPKIKLNHNIWNVVLFLDLLASLISKSCIFVIIVFI